MKPESKIYVAGHKGMVGSSILALLKQQGYSNLITRTSQQLDLRNQQAVNLFFETEKPAYVFLAAAKVGGIFANNEYPAQFIYDNLAIEANVIHAAYRYGVNKLLFLGSSCIYPKFAPQPLKEEYLLSGYLEPTNEWYAIAKIAGIKLCEAYRKQYGCNFIAAMPTNLYGTNDNYHPQNSHVIPAMLLKMHTAKVEKQPTVQLWGTGTPKREFLHVNDLANASVFLMQQYNEAEFVNVGTGIDITIKELAELVKATVQYEGLLEWDSSKPDGTPRKLLDVSKIEGLGWKAQISLEMGLKSVYAEVQKNGSFI